MKFQPYTTMKKFLITIIVLLPHMINAQEKLIPIAGFKEGLALAKAFPDRKYGFIDKAGELVIPCKWNDAYEYCEGLAAVRDSNNKWGFIDKAGNLAISCKWEDVSWFHEGLVSVRKTNGKYGYIDKTGKVVLSTIWNQANDFSEGLAYVSLLRSSYFIDTLGNFILEEENNIFKKGFRKYYPPLPYPDF